MNKTVSEEEWVEARKTLLRENSLYINIIVIVALSAMILSAAPFVLDQQQQSLAQRQRTTDTGNQIENLFFDTDNITSSVNGIKMHYVTGGKGDPIVLLHGWPETWYVWRHVIPELIANNYSVIAPDMRGLGDSEKPLSGYDKRTLAEDIYQLVKKLGYNKIYIVAHDWGGPVAYSYAAEHPENVSKMVILDTLLPGFGYEEAGNFSPNGIWHFSFHAVRDLPEKLIEGQEDDILIGFMILFI